MGVGREPLRRPQPLRRAVFLDRDGVVNAAIVRDGRPYPPGSLAELRILDDVPEALRALKARGFELIVVTNQPDVARGTQTRAEVDRLNGALAERLPIDAFAVCDHDDADGCDCRKPLPGLLLQAAAERDIDLGRSYLIGDRWRDIVAGRAAGVRTVFVDRGYTERRPDPAADATSFETLEAVRWILDDARPCP